MLLSDWISILYGIDSMPSSILFNVRCDWSVFRRWEATRDNAPDKLMSLLDDGAPEVRASAVYALATFIRSLPLNDRSDQGKVCKKTTTKFFRSGWSAYWNIKWEYIVPNFLSMSYRINECDRSAISLIRDESPTKCYRSNWYSDFPINCYIMNCPILDLAKSWNGSYN